ncbi:MAG: choice-of-anchor A family protein [Armatimonadetes bacterium]|nr:choice-of-anchor A family protein [Armatimonadota bacterium]
MKIIQTTAIALLAIFSAAAAQAQALGGAQPYNVYVLGNAWQQGADAEGGVAVTGNLNVGDWGFTTGWNGGGKLVVGGDLNNLGHSVHPDGVFTGGDLNYRWTLTSYLGSVEANGNVFIGGGQPGSVKHGGTFAYTGTETFPTSTGTSASPVDFAATNAYLTSQSAYLGTLSGTSIMDATPTGGYFDLDVSGGGLKVFNFTERAFENSWFINFKNAAPDTTVLVNVAGTNITAPNGNYLYNYVNYPDGPGVGNVLFNFPDATELRVDAMGGSILAPKATLDMNYGVIYGSVVVGQLGTENDPSVGQFNQRDRFGNDVKFRGRLPQIPEPGTLALAGLGLAGLAARRRRK